MQKYIVYNINKCKHNFQQGGTDIMIKKKKWIATVVTITLMLGLIPYAGHIKPISKAAEHGLSSPRVAPDDTVTWDCVYFGNYWQNDTNGDGKADQNDEKEPIKWRVLSVDGNDAFLLSDMALDTKPYNEEKKFATWENCTLRKWLNDSFYNVAFTDKEKNVITETKATNISGDCVLDKVSVLSDIDARNASYGFNYEISGTDKFYNKSYDSETREAKNSAYANANGAFSHRENGCWWLRPYDERGEYIYKVDAGGQFDYHHSEYINTTTTVVRPCMHINLLSDAWSKADTVTATGGSFVTPTPTTAATPTATPTFTPTPTPPQKVTSTPTQKATSAPTVTPTITPDNGKNNSPTSSPEQSIQSKESPKVTNEPKTVTAPAKVKGLSAKNKKKKTVVLSWKKVKGATGYQIQYSANGTVKKTMKNTKKTKLTIKKLKKKKTYSFRVRAYTINSGIKIYGNWCKAKKVKIKK